MAGTSDVTAQKPAYSTSHQLFVTTESLPPGAVLLTKDQIHAVQMKAIKDWKPARHMWPLTHGSQVLGALASLGGFFFVSHFRGAMALRSNARLTSIIPAIFFPGVVTSLAHQSFVVQPMITGSVTCPVCLELRGIAIQVALGVAQPFMLAVIASTIVARTAQTYALPPLADPYALLKVFRRMIRPIRSNIMGILTINIAGTAVIIYSQGRASERLHQSITDDKLSFVS